MKQIIYLRGKKARNYTAPHEETDVIGDCDWKKGEVKTKDVDYKVKRKSRHEFEDSAPVSVIVPIPKKQEVEEELWKAAAEMLYQKHSSAGDILYGVLKGFQKDMIFLSEHFTITRKS